MDTDIANKPLAAGSVTYSIYRGKSADFAPVRPLNSTPLTTTEYTDTAFETGQAYYYFVRAHTSTQKQAQESAGSNVILLFPQDTFPPTPPQELNVVAAREGMVLIWAPNPERDVAGYNVYRSDTSATGYAKINGDLVRETTYTDASVKPRQKYYYVVTAVDSAPVPNESKYSDEIAEVLRK